MRLPDGWRPSRGFGIHCATQFQGFDVTYRSEEKQSQGEIVARLLSNVLLCFANCGVVGALMLSPAILTTGFDACA